MSIKYCVTITTRGNNFKNVTTKYCEFNTVYDLNDYLFKNICNTCISDEIVGLHFEVISE